MKVAFITGSSGLVGSEAVYFFARKGFKIVGIDNNMREYFFGRTSSTLWNRDRLVRDVPNYIHENIDIRNQKSLQKLFKKYGSQIHVIIHAAAQPSHDWAAKEPLTDFTINANGTLYLLELTRQFSPESIFIYLSTNKVYGDNPNQLPLSELAKRWELPKNHVYFEGIDETMNIDQCMHSLFGASKLAADVLVQEYGRYFKMNTAVIRAGCLTGPKHSGAMLHGFLSYLMKCCVAGTKYTIFGYKGKQVRDNLHSFDLINAFYKFYLNPKQGEVYNLGGGRFSNCSVLEAIALCEEISGNKMKYDYSKSARKGDHQWYITSNKKFRSHYSSWKQEYDLRWILTEIYQEQTSPLRRD